MLVFRHWLIGLCFLFFSVAIVMPASRKTACQFILEHSVENEAFWKLMWDNGVFWNKRIELFVLRVGSVKIVELQAGSLKILDTNHHRPALHDRQAGDFFQGAVDRAVGGVMQHENQRHALAFVAFGLEHR